MFGEQETLNLSDFSKDILTVTSADTVMRHTIIVIFQWIILAVASQVTVVFGIATNIINIMCFAKQGFKDPVNVSLLGLAISDLGCLATLIWTNICFTPAFIAADLPFDTIDVQYLTGGIPHTTFSRVSAWITAFITMERCLCITAPFKVKHVITSKRASFIIIGIFITLIASVGPIYVLCSFGAKYSPERNRTVIGLVFSDNREIIEKVSFITNNVFIPFSAFTVILICTIILVVTLQRKTKWRMVSMTAVQADSVSVRNQNVAKMVVIISSVFIVCFFPISILFLVMTLDPKFSIGGRYINILYLLGGASFVLESINSSVNFFIYYHMSSKFRDTFGQICTRRKEH